MTDTTDTPENNCDGADLAFLPFVDRENHHEPSRCHIPKGNEDAYFSVFKGKYKILIVLEPAYFPFFLRWLKVGAGESISMDPNIDEYDGEINNRLRAEQDGAGHLKDTSSYVTPFKRRPFKNMQAYTLDQIFMTHNVLEISRNDGIYKNLLMPSFLTSGNITITQIFPVSDAAATCSDLPYTVTDCADTATVSAAEFLEDSSDVGVFTLKNRNDQVAKSSIKKTKTQKNKKTRSSTLSAAAACSTAQILDGGEINEEYGLYTSELEHANPEDGKYKKEIYLRTWTGRTITAVIDLESEVKNLKRLAAAKTGIPTESQQLTFGGKVLTDKMLIKEYNISGGENIEMTAKLLGGMKKKSLSPRPMDTERDKKRKESEPCIEVGHSLEEENAQTHLDIDASDNARWIEDAMKRLKDRTDDVSELETNMSGVQWQMTEVEKRLETVSDSLIKLSEGKAEQDQKLDALLCCFKEGMEVREKKIEAKMENMEKSLSERMNDKFSEFDMRITSIECSVVGGAGHVGPGSALGGWGPTPTGLKAVIHGFKKK